MLAQLPPEAVYNWTGWYVGLNAGASFGKVKTDFNAPGTAAVTVGSLFGAGTFGFAGSDTVYPSGFMGGGQIGYNWQLSPIWVVGIEADFQGADEKDHGTLTSNFSAPLLPVTINESVSGTTALDYAAKIEWFGTARLRAGYVWGEGNVMSYVTGGLAYGKVVTPLPSSVTQAFDHSNVNIGWVVGYGTRCSGHERPHRTHLSGEGRLAIPGWTWKVESLWMDLGHLDARGSGGSTRIGDCAEVPTPGCFIFTAGPITTHSHFTDGILRGGLNYRFY